MEAGQPARTGLMDLDRALVVVLASTPDTNDAQAAREALAMLVSRARQYVAGPSPGRLAALCQVLQEPVPEQRAPADAETVVQAFLTERNLRVISAEAARRLGIDGSFW